MDAATGSRRLRLMDGSSLISSVISLRDLRYEPEPSSTQTCPKLNPVSEQT